MLDPFFLNELNHFRGKAVDERIPMFHPAAVPVLLVSHDRMQGNYSANDTVSQDRAFETRFGITHETQQYINGSALHEITTSEPPCWNYLPLENQIAYNASHAGDGLQALHAVYGTAAAASNDYYNKRYGMAVCLTNTTDQAVTIPANTWGATLTSGDPNARAVVSLYQPDDVNGSVTSVTRTTLFSATGTTGNTWNCTVPIVVPAGHSFMLGFAAANFWQAHDTTYDLTYGFASITIRNILGIMTGGDTANYVKGSYDTKFTANYKMLLALTDGAANNYLDIFNATGNHLGKVA
jgi:hypothetical protein